MKNSGRRNTKLGARQEAIELRDELIRKRVLVPFEGQRRYLYPHRSIAEYLAAGELARSVKRGSGWDLVDRKAWDPDWAEVFPFLTGHLAKSPQLAGRVLVILKDENKDDDFRHRLALAAQCLPEARGLSGGVPDEIATTVVTLCWNVIKQNRKSAFTTLLRGLSSIGHSGRRVGHVSLEQWLLDELSRDSYQ